MKEIRIHARAGQGAITTAALLGYAYFLEGMYPYAFPHFGAARMGAPMNAFVRVDSQPVMLRSQIYEPDYVVVLDPTLIEIAGVTEGLSKQGKLVINSEKEHAVDGFDTYFVDATQIAIDNLGVPIVNTAMLGAFAGATKEVTFESLKEALMERFGGRLGPKNCKAAEIAYKEVKKF